MHRAGARVSIVSMKQKITLAVLAVFIVGASIIVLFNRGTIEPGSVPTTNQPSATVTTVTPAIAPVSSPSLPPTKPPSSPTAYTLAQVATHDSAASCWSAINGKVYDLTSWINQHPGGPQAILSICGVDGSSAFNDQHGGQSRPANELAGFAIGTLAN